MHTVEVVFGVCSGFIAADRDDVEIEDEGEDEANKEDAGRLTPICNADDRAGEVAWLLPGPVLGGGLLLFGLGAELTLLLLIGERTPGLVEVALGTLSLRLFRS